MKGLGVKQGTAGAAVFAFRESSVGRVGRAWGQRAQGGAQAQEGGDASVLGRCLWGWTHGSLAEAGPGVGGHGGSEGDAERSRYTLSLSGPLEPCTWRCRRLQGRARLLLSRCLCCC